MDQLKEAYIAQGYPPHREWWFSMDQGTANLLVGEGMIELVDTDQWCLTEPGHEYCMGR
jgi:hypothetical protein